MFATVACVAILVSVFKPKPPLNDRVVVQPIDVEETTAGQIVVPKFISTSSFFDCEHTDVLTNVYRRLDLPDGGHTEGVSRHLSEKRINLVFGVPPSMTRQRFMREYAREIESLLKEHGCEINGRGVSLGAAVEFNLGYCHGDGDTSYGSVHLFWGHTPEKGVVVTNSQEQLWRLIIFICEFERPPSMVLGQ